jgi:hypothetical protein
MTSHAEQQSVENQPLDRRHFTRKMVLFGPPGNLKSLNRRLAASSLEKIIGVKLFERTSREVASAHGDRLAPCTIDNPDYKFNETYVLALARHDGHAAAKVRAEYIAYAGAEIDWYTALDKQVFGYVRHTSCCYTIAPRILGSGNFYRWALVLHVKVSGATSPIPHAWLDQYAKNPQVNW